MGKDLRERNKQILDDRGGADTMSIVGEILSEHHAPQLPLLLLMDSAVPACSNGPEEKQESPG